MKVFKVEASGFTYDEYDSCVIVAESEERALEIAQKSNGAEDKLYFSEDQYPLNVKEINTDKEQIVDTSFNAG